MSGASLLNRLERAADPNASARTFYRGEDLETVVVEHLQRMLNTRAGSSLTAPDYGMVELAELLHDFPDANAIVQRAIKNTIVKYEPRLKNVQVRVVEREDERDSLFIFYEITAQLCYPNGDRQPVRLSTAVDESSNVRLG